MKQKKWVWEGRESKTGQGERGKQINRAGMQPVNMASVYFGSTARTSVMRTQAEGGGRDAGF